MNKCKECGSSMTQLFTSLVCSAECDLKPRREVKLLLSFDENQLYWLSRIPLSGQVLTATSTGNAQTAAQPTNIPQPPTAQPGQPGSLSTPNQPQAALQTGLVIADLNAVKPNSWFRVFSTLSALWWWTSAHGNEKIWQVEFLSTAGYWTWIHSNNYVDGSLNNSLRISTALAVDTCRIVCQHMPASASIPKAANVP